MKTVDFKKTIYELCDHDENIINILAEIGFKDILKPGMINTAGRFMTIPKGSKAKGFELESVKKEFIKNGYEIIE